jgi:hypothetical protein
MAVELVDQFWWDLVNSMAWVHGTLVHYVVRVLSACNTSFVDLLMFPFDGFKGMYGENSCNVLMLLFMVLWILLFAMLCTKVVLMLWHAFIFLGLRHGGLFPPFSFCLVFSISLSCKKILSTKNKRNQRNQYISPSFSLI